jgi:putative CocE/NonD family hydrolase
MRTHLNVAVPLRDGVVTAADVYLPEADGRFSTVVARTPYNKNNAFAADKARLYTSRGYAFVWMDVRGRGDSDGVFTPYRYEGVDGYDAVEWAAVQKWSNGDVVTWGQSYLGCIQWLTALERPPHLRAMVVYVTPSDPFVEWPTGTQLPQQICWHRMVDGRVLQHVDSIDWLRVYEQLPLLTLDEAAGFVGPHWREDLTHAPADEYWRPLRYQERLDEVDLPVMHVTGWYDDVQPGSLINFSRMIEVAPTDAARRAQRLVVGPWDHGLTRQRERFLGDVDFGPDATSFDLDEHELRWLDHYVRGIDNSADVDPRASLFVMGRNEWRTEDEWPLVRAADARYYLSSGGGANSRLGDGALLREQAPSAHEPPDEYVADPTSPVPFLTAASSAQIGGPDDYAEVELREDVLVYTTAPLETEVEVTGLVRLQLFASSDAVDTDFMAKLVDVHPNGFCQRLCDGMTRARFRRGLDREILLEPGAVERFDIDLWSTSHVFLPGHAIRLELASSAFPKYDRNLQTGEPLATAVAPSVATNRVWHTAAHPSRLVLPEVAS